MNPNNKRSKLTITNHLDQSLYLSTQEQVLNCAVMLGCAVAKVLNPSYFIAESVVQAISDLHSKHVLQYIGGDALSLHLFRMKEKLKHVSFMSLSV
jgi:hypothetical protein